jgi:hypothetical protein
LEPLMSDPLTPNKGLDLPTTGEYPSAWGPVVNGNFTDIDTALGGVTVISVASVPGGTYTLSPAQYQPPNIEFGNALTTNLTYLIPAGVGGMWSVWNNTTGAFTLTFGSGGGGSYVVPQGYRVLLVSQGTAMQLATQVSGAPANPTALVGLAAVNGASANFMRADAAPALDQSIAPTWTGVQNFNAQVNINDALALYGAMVLAAAGSLDASAGTEVLVPTVGAGNSTTHAASTAFVAASFAPLASPALSGTPTAPTAAAGTNNTQIATTAFAQGPARNLASNGYIKFASGFIIQWGINSFTSGGSAITFSAVGGIAFPNNFFTALVSAYGASATAFMLSGTTTTLTAVNGISSTNSWIALGN